MRPVIPQTPNTQPPPYLPPVGWRPGYRQEPQELGYHRLALTDPKSRWWKPLVESVIGAPLYLVLALILSIALLIPSLMSALKEQAASGQMTIDATATASDMTAQLQAQALTDPLIFTVLFGSVALMFPCLWLARLIMGPKPWGLIHSVAGRMRWGWLMVCLGLSTLIMVLIPLALEAATGSTYQLAPQAQGTTLIVLLICIGLVVPFQAYAEELVFRGFLMQSIGRWLKHPAWAIVLPAPLFMLGHMYDLWGQLSVLTLGIAAGYITWRTGGLEAAIALHTVNNLIAMTFGVFGLADPFLQEGSNLAGFTSSLITNGIFVLVVVLLAKKKNLARTRRAQVWVKEQPTPRPAPVR
ncbi:lysostaphin resistance A-like protein [Rothia sp. CCM 9416]|uniref:CPBP family intramembrane glutamic endopeptidase n=1 Tax=Rothia sp. CCM 9416 TaxID=3402655 RepID=UPI003AE3B08C